MPLSAERWQRVKELFDAAVDLPRGERAALLERACHGDETLRVEVESLLQSDDDASTFIEKPALPLARDVLNAISGNEPVVGRQFGAYRIVRELGRGGLGTVYLAARADDQFQKEVAIKVVRRGLDTDDILQRFRSERQILAQLEHPNIARLIDAGSTDDGLPYFVMEYVEGEPISSYCATHNLGTAERLRLFRDVCSAVTYAHQHLVIHRDIKPSNILVTRDGIPKLLDFGIAKVLHADDPLAANTMTGARVMTPEYASPEQVRGAAITTATDIYSLGVLLYELLTGQKPYRLTSHSAEEVSRAVVDQVPERPSTAVSRSIRAAEARPHNRKSLRGDLDNIVLMALRKEPERRYSSVAQFSADIGRHLDGLPVVAHKDTVSYRAAKFIKRNKLGVAAAVLLLLTLLAGIVATGWQANNAMRQARIAAEERDRARKQATKADRLNAFLQNILGFADPTWLSPNPNRNREATIADALDQAGRRAITELADEPEILAAVQFTIGWTYKALGQLDRAEPHLRGSLDVRRKHLGPDHQDTAQSMIGLGELYMFRAQFAEMEAIDREAVDIYRRAAARGEVDQKWFAIALNDLGAAYIALGQPQKGEPLVKEAIEITREFTGMGRAPLGVMLNNLGVMSRDRGDLDGSVSYLEESLREYRNLPAEAGFEMGTALHNMAFALFLKGEYDRAEPVAREGREVLRNSVGEKHPYTARPWITLSGIAYRRGDYRKAREEIEGVLKFQELGISPGHVDFALSWTLLGKILTRLGETAEAEAYLRRALELRTRALAPGHVMIGDTQGALGDLLRTLRRWEEAEPLLISARDIAQARLGERDPRTIEAAEQLSTFYAERDGAAAAVSK